MKNITKDTANQLYSIINLLPEAEKNKIPKEIIDILNEKLLNENLSITDVSQIREENLLEDTKKYLAYIFLNYLSNENEKKELKKILNLNEQRYQDNLKKKYDVSNIFGNNKVDIKENSGKEELIVIKDKKWWEKIIDKLKNLITK